MLDGFHLEVHIQGWPVKMPRRRSSDIEHILDSGSPKPREAGEGHQMIPAVDADPHPVSGDPGHFDGVGVLPMPYGSHSRVPG